MKIVVTSIPDNNGDLVAYRIENRSALWHALEDLGIIENGEYRGGITEKNYMWTPEVEWHDFIEQFNIRGSFQVQEI